MKYFKLEVNVFKMTEIPECFLLKSSYSGLPKNSHICIKEISNGLFVIEKINGSTFVKSFGEYSFHSLLSSDIMEMTLENYLNLKAFL